MVAPPRRRHIDQTGAEHDAVVTAVVIATAKNDINTAGALADDEYVGPRATLEHIIAPDQAAGN